MKESRRKKLNKLLNVYIGVGVLLWVAAALLILTPILPQLVYKIYPDAAKNEVKSLTTSIEDEQNKLAELRDKYTDEPEDPLPPFDPSLPVQNTLKINSIGVDSQIQTGTDWESALNRGPWIVNNFGTPGDSSVPVIIASHRWGAIGWSSEKRNTSSFLKLPDTKIGDRVEVIWGQRKFEYEIYGGEENTEISDYEADLVLYTCKLFWESPVRIFRYAKRI